MKGEKGDLGPTGPPGLPGEKGARGKRGKRVRSHDPTTSPACYIINACEQKETETIMHAVALYINSRAHQHGII